MSRKIYLPTLGIWEDIDDGTLLSDVPRIVDGALIDPVAGTDVGLLRTFKASGAANSLLSALESGQNARMLVLGDSTADTSDVDDVLGNESGDWPWQLARKMSVRYPNITVAVYKWGGTGYSLNQTVQTGTAANYLRIYVCAVAGKACRYHLGAYSQAMIRDTSAQYVVINHGYNEASSSELRSNMLALIGTVRDMLPDAGINLTLENPQVGTSAMTSRVPYVLQAAVTSGAGVVDSWSEMRAIPDWETAFFGVDITHPLDAGQALLATVQARHIVYGPPQALAPGFVHRPNLISSPKICDAAGVRAAGWAGDGAQTMTAEVSVWETGGRAAKLLGTGWEEYTVSSDRLRVLAGRVVTLVTRLYVPAGATTSYAGRTRLRANGSDAVMGTVYRDADDAWRYEVISASMPDALTSLRVGIAYAGTTGVYVDRAWLGVGLAVGDALD